MEGRPGLQVSNLASLSFSSSSMHSAYWALPLLLHNVVLRIRVSQLNLSEYFVSQKLPCKHEVHQCYILSQQSKHLILWKAKSVLFVLST